MRNFGDENRKCTLADTKKDKERLSFELLEMWQQQEE